MVPEPIDAPGRADGGIVTEWRSGGSERPGADRTALNLSKGLAVAVCTLDRPESLTRFLRSLADQDRLPDQLVIVDASAGDASEKALREFLATRRPAAETSYLRVFGSWIGLTRQRNVAVGRTRVDLVAFFDDDIVLLDGCLRELESAHRSVPGIVGAAARIENEASRPGALWILRRALGIVPTLAPGRYVRGGMSIPWGFAFEPAGSLRDGDWLPGGATMWVTAAARDVRFDEGLSGYGQAEDLDFSLRVRRLGRLVLCGGARVRHLHESAGRPDRYRLGYMAIRNRYWIHQGAFGSRRWRAAAWFAYVWSVDTLLLARHFLFPRRWAATGQELRGRARAGYDIVRGR